ncbi:hypothetical protein GCM10007973_29860 [Polymorphobacter multimanifer]|uniref:hypothetical protein n=1 Tax=Polymorphobacter multimanifer TaxID=1070431 RepID=UPI001665DB51|nr:hypothetical protein [Polymorphobacter multimanifer]GGI91612.1 hypothetical protein GCM10007973_29860 [Polymorphobacter multimanifer]
MSVSVTGVGRIRHADTGTIYTIGPNELDWQGVGAEERSMGAEVTYEAAIEHTDLGSLTWTVWEYPIGAFNDQETEVGRHTLLENFQLGISDSDDAAVDREGRIQAMVDWFFENFEDPANRTPYESAEGGYIWIWGGPHDAAEEIGSNFSDEDQELIDAAVERVQRDGLTEWAPTEGPDDYDPEPNATEGEPDDEEASAENNEEDDGSGSSLEEILATIPPEPSGPIFDRTQQKKPDGALLSALREQATELVTHLEGTNGHQDLLQALIRYVATVNAAPASIPRLYTEGVFLENTAAQCEQEIAAGDRPPLPSTVSSGLASIRQLHGALIMSTPTGSALVEAADRYRAPSEDRDRLSQSIAEVAQAIRNTPSVFGPTARELAELAGSNAGKGERPERSNHAASLLVKRMLAGVGKILRFTGYVTIATVVGDGLTATGAGGFVMNSVTSLGNSAWVFLVSNIDAVRAFAAVAGADLVWLRQLVAWLQARL